MTGLGSLWGLFEAPLGGLAWGSMWGSVRGVLWVAKMSVLLLFLYVFGGTRHPFHPVRSGPIRPQERKEAKERIIKYKRTI